MSVPDWTVPLETTSCPSCGDVQPDFDGVGHVYCKLCGWCDHLAWTPMPGGCDVCDFCGEERENGSER